MGCESTSETSPEVGETNGDKVSVSGVDGATYQVATHGYRNVFGDADYYEIDSDVDHNRCHMQSWWDDSLRVENCEGYEVTVWSESVKYRVEADSNYDWWFQKIEPDHQDLNDGTGYSTSVFVSAGGLLTAGVQAGVNVSGDGEYAEHQDYSHVEWQINLRNENWPDCQDPSPGVKFDVVTDLTDGSFAVPCKSVFEYRWPCGSGYVYESTPEVSYDAGFAVI